MVKDIRPGSGSSDPLDLTNVNGTLFFRAWDSVNGTELWKSDGTEAGTVMVKDIRPGSGSSNPRDLTNLNGTLFFRANDGVNGYELWKSDGTESGTVMVKDIFPGSGSSDPRDLTNVNGTLFFRADNGFHGEELWMSDGTAASTVMVKDVLPGSGSSNIGNLQNVNGTLFFRANDGVHGDELWMSDGTEAGTVLAADVFPGPGGSDPTNLTVVDDTLFFSAVGPGVGRELWSFSLNAAPTDISLSHSLIAENAAIGSVVGTFSTVDPNPGDTFTYVLVTGDGDDDNASFTLDGDELKTAVALDFDQQSLYSIRVRSTDQGGLSTEKVFLITVEAVTELTGIDVQLGQTQRSYVRYLDVNFTRTDELAQWIAEGRFQLTRYDLEGENPVAVPLTAAMFTIIGTGVRIDFGIQGIGGNRNTNAGDGYYEIGIDLNNDGLVDQTRNFFRLLGDVNGDGVVNALDRMLVQAAMGTTNPEYDVNGTGVVSAIDRALVLRALNRKLKDGLWVDA